MAEREEELKSLLMKVKVESEKVGLKLNIQKNPQKSPDTPGSPEENTEGPGTASSEPLPPPDRDRRGDSPAWSGRGSRPSRRTSG